MAAIVAKASYNTGVQDFIAQITNVSGENPDVIFAPGNDGESTEEFTGATGYITLDGNGEAVKSAIIKQVEKGEFIYLTTVEPY